MSTALREFQDMEEEIHTLKEFKLQAEQQIKDAEELTSQLDSQESTIKQQIESIHFYRSKRLQERVIRILFSNAYKTQAITNIGLSTSILEVTKDLHNLAEKRDQEIMALNNDLNDLHATIESTTRGHSAELDKIQDSTEATNQFINELLHEIQDHQKDLHDLTQMKDQEISNLRKQLQIQENDAQIHDYIIQEARQQDLQEASKTAESNILSIHTDYGKVLQAKNSKIQNYKEKFIQLQDSFRSEKEILTRGSNEKKSEIQKLRKGLAKFNDSLSTEKTSKLNAERELSNLKSAFLQMVDLSVLSIPHGVQMRTWNGLISALTQDPASNPTVKYGPRHQRWYIIIRSNVHPLLPGWQQEMKISSKSAAILLYVMISENVLFDNLWLTIQIMQLLRNSMPMVMDPMVPIIISKSIDKYIDLFCYRGEYTSVRLHSTSLALIQLWLDVLGRFHNDTWERESNLESLLGSIPTPFQYLHEVMQVDDIDEILVTRFPPSDTKFVHDDQGGIYAIPESQWYIFISRSGHPITLFDKHLLIFDRDMMDIDRYKIEGPEGFDTYRFHPTLPRSKEWFIFNLPLAKDFGSIVARILAGERFFPSR